MVKLGANKDPNRGHAQQKRKGKKGTNSKKQYAVKPLRTS